MRVTYRCCRGDACVARHSRWNAPERRRRRPYKKRNMQIKRLLSVVAAAGLLYTGCQQPPPAVPPRVEIPVTNQPGRATNDDMAFRVPSDREPRPRATPAPKQGVTIVEGSSESPTAVAQADTKPQQAPIAKEQPANEPAQPGRSSAEPTPSPTVEDASAPAASPAKSTGEAQVAASQPAGYGAEQYRLVNQSDEIVSVLKN